MATAAYVAYGVIAAASVYSADQQKSAATKQRRAERQARSVENARERFRTQRDKQKLLAQLRVQRAQQEALGVSQGVSGSSAVQGATASSTAQALGNVAFAQQQTSLFEQAANIRGRGAEAASRSLGRADTAQAVDSIAGLFTDPSRNEKLF